MRPDLMELEAGSTTIPDILPPTTVNTRSLDYIVVDGVFHAYLYITSLKNLSARGDSVLADKTSRLIIWYSLQTPNAAFEYEFSRE